MKFAHLVMILPLAALLVSCHRDEGISVKGHSLILHATHAQPAIITSTGDFSVGSMPIESTHDQRKLLIRYYHAVMAIRFDTKGLKNAGVSISHEVEHSIRKTVGAAESNHTKDAGKGLQAAGDEIKRNVDHICRDIKTAKRLQASLARQIGAFRSYAHMRVSPHVRCSSYSWSNH